MGSRARGMDWLGKNFTKKLEDRGEFKRRKNPEQTNRGFAGLRLKVSAEAPKTKASAPPPGGDGDEPDPDVADLLNLPKGQPTRGGP